MNANGRVNILEEPPQNVFNLYDRIPINEKITSYKDALTGNFEQSNLSRAFFSAKNIIIIQNALMSGVHKASNGNFNIGYQNEDTLKIIMRSVFLQHSANLCNNITEQIVGLNGSAYADGILVMAWETLAAIAMVITAILTV